MTSARDPRHTPNRLAREKSPYLLQHAHNPVDWYPWGDEAFAKARRENKPIFLSIGYSTCHWCHVMERESFENDAVAAVLNRDFVPIKVDREERPDVDRIYMNALMQAMGLGGGWPLNAFLTPDLEAVLTAAPTSRPHARYGRPGLIQVLPRVHEVWTERRAEVESTGAADLRPPRRRGSGDGGSGGSRSAVRGRAPLARGRGGSRARRLRPGTEVSLAVQPRLPDAHVGARSRAALRRARAGAEAARRDARGRHPRSSRRRLPPLHRRSPRGWSRTSRRCSTTRRRSRGPTSRPIQATGRPEYAEAARGVLDYVARDLAAPEGGFYSAEDADSEGEEGKFYVWTPAEVEAIAGEDAAALLPSATA